MSASRLARWLAHSRQNARRNFEAFGLTGSFQSQMKEHISIEEALLAKSGGGTTLRGGRGVGSGRRLFSVAVAVNNWKESKSSRYVCTFRIHLVSSIIVQLGERMLPEKIPSMSLSQKRSAAPPCRDSDMTGDQQLHTIPSLDGRTSPALGYKPMGPSTPRHNLFSPVSSFKNHKLLFSLC